MSVRLGSGAPNFKASTTQGKVDFHQWLGESWGLLFSHPEDYTPVCTTELGMVAQLKNEFDKRDVKAIALSVDSIDSHRGWIKDIEKTMKVKVEYPIIADTEKEVATLYSMVHEGESNNATIRSVFIISPDKKVKLILTYPMAVGRNFDEIIRVIDALQLTEKKPVVTPANWNKSEQVIIDPNMSQADADANFPEGYDEVTNYLRYTPDPLNR